MVRAGIKSRLEAIEHLSKHIETPDLVMIYRDPAGDGWIAKETYVKRATGGKVIPGSGVDKFILLDSPEAYEPSEGFSGVILTEGEMLS